ncbi:MAG: SDR family oxidoreductase [Cyanobacteria bacterium P01_F01_bin.116]
MAKYHNKVVLITGASAGIGEALAREYASQGANLVLLARRYDKLAKIVANIDPTGQRVLALSCDVTKDNDLEKAVSLAHQKFARIDIAIANAGWSLKGNLENLSLDDYRRQWETNVFGVLRTIYATLDDLKQTQGRLAIIGSVKSYLALTGDSAYSSGKFALRGLCEALTGELAPYGISVTLICPGYVATEIRQIDQQGKFHNDWQDQTSSRLLMDAQTAAKQMITAIHRRQREQIQTPYGKLVVFLIRHLPGVVFWLTSRLNVKVAPRHNVPNNS